MLYRLSYDRHMTVCIRITPLFASRAYPLTYACLRRNRHNPCIDIYSFMFIHSYHFWGIWVFDCLVWVWTILDVRFNVLQLVSMLGYDWPMVVIRWRPYVLPLTRFLSFSKRLELGFMGLWSYFWVIFGLHIERVSSVTSWLRHRHPTSRRTTFLSFCLTVLENTFNSAFLRGKHNSL